MIDGKITLELISREEDSFGKICIIEKTIYSEIVEIHSNMVFLKSGGPYCLGSHEDECFGHWCCYSESDTRLKRSEAIEYHKLLSDCPTCQTKSGSVEIYFNNKNIKAPVVGPEINYTEILHKCRKCNTEWYNEETDLNIEEALRISTKLSIPIILDRINVLYGYTDSNVERILHLKFGSLRQWRQGDYTPEAAALLRILYKEPRLLLED